MRQKDKTNLEQKRCGQKIPLLYLIDKFHLYIFKRIWDSMNPDQQIIETSPVSHPQPQHPEEPHAMSPISHEGSLSKLLLFQANLQPQGNDLQIDHLNSSQDNLKESEQSHVNSAALSFNDQGDIEWQPVHDVSDILPPQNVSALVGISSIHSDSEYDSRLSASSEASETTRITWRTQTQNLIQEQDQNQKVHLQPESPARFFIKHFLDSVSGKPFQNYEKDLLNQISSDQSQQELLYVFKHVRQGGQLRACLQQFFKPQNIRRLVAQSEIPTQGSKNYHRRIGERLYLKLSKSEPDTDIAFPKNEKILQPQ